MSRAAVHATATVRALDAAVIGGLGLPSVVLMEQAGAACAARLRALLGGAGGGEQAGRVRVAVLCGPGNNGGDGYVITRHLHLAGVGVVAVPVYPAASADARAHAAAVLAMGLGADAVPPGVELVVDAVFGTGQRAPLALPPVPGLDAALARGAQLVAIDVPTGLDADTGARVGSFPPPHRVLTIGAWKGFVLAGLGVPVELVDIGLAAGEAWARATDPPHPALSPPLAWRAEGAALFGALPGPHPTADKWAHGHVAVLAGSAEKGGAGVLAALGALRGGAGLVTLCIPREAWGRLDGLPAEVMLAEPDAAFAGGLRADVVVAGPGLGRALDARLRAAWVGDPRPWVFDADALRALDNGALRALDDGAPRPPRLITPHLGEAAALLRAWAGPAPATGPAGGRTPGAAPEARIGDHERLATVRALRGIAPTVLKGAWPLVSGEPPTGVPGEVEALGVGGSGDVFAGLCGALLAQARGPAWTPERVEALALAAVGLQLVAARAAGPLGTLPSEVAARLPTVRAGLG